MKGVVHFTGITGRESSFDPTKNRDIARSTGRLEELPSTRLVYELNASYEYLKRHSPSAVAYDLFRQPRFADDAKSVKRKTEEDEQEQKKLILYPKFDYLSQKGHHYPSVSFPKAKRNLIASPADLVSESPQRSTRIKAETEEGKSDTGEEDLGGTLLRTQDVRKPSEVFSGTGTSTRPPERKELSDAEKRRMEREKVWAEMHNHVPGAYVFDQSPGRSGLSPRTEREKRKRRLSNSTNQSSKTPSGGTGKASKEKRDQVRSQTVPLTPETVRVGAQSPEPPHPHATIAHTSNAKRAKDIQSLEWHLSLMAAKDKRQYKAHLFRSDIGRDKPVLGLAKGFELHSYTTDIDPELSRLKQVDRDVPKVGIGNAIRFPELELEHQAKQRETISPKSKTVPNRLPADDQEAQDKFGDHLAKSKRLSDRESIPAGSRRGSSITGPLPSIQTPTVLTPIKRNKKGRSLLFDNLHSNSTPSADDSLPSLVGATPNRSRSPVSPSAEASEKGQQPIAAAILAREKAKAQKVPIRHAAVGHTHFHLEDFLHSKQFKAKLKAYEQELIRTNLEQLDLGPEVEAALLGRPLDQKVKKKAKTAKDGSSPQAGTVKAEPVRKLVEEEEQKIEQLQHLAALMNISVDHDDTRVQWKGVLPKERQLVVDVGALVPRFTDTGALASWTTPEILKMKKLKAARDERQRQLDMEYQAALKEYKESLFDPSRGDSVPDAPSASESAPGVDLKPMQSAPPADHGKASNPSEGPNKKVRVTALSDYIPQA